MEDLIKTWDGESVISRYDAETGTWMFIAIHSTALGKATGGTRMKPYPNPTAALQDADLSRVAYSYLESDMAVYKKGRHGYSGHFNRTLGIYDFSGSARFKKRTL